MFLSTIVFCALSVLLLITIFFILAIIFKNNSIADIAWGLGFIVIALVSLGVNGLHSPRQIIITLLVLLWGTRLALHIFLRNKGKEEDFRYKKWRQDWGKLWIVKSYLYVFLLQGALMLLVSLPVSATNAFIPSTPELTVLDQIGVCIWLIGFYFEAVGDIQLMQFKRNKNNMGKILKTGLWRYTRHPNYFGEAMMWWGIYGIALSNPNLWWTFIGPLFITFSLLKVSGVSLLEKKYKGNKEYREYQKNTSSFIPWFPKE